MSSDALRGYRPDGWSERRALQITATGLFGYTFPDRGTLHKAPLVFSYVSADKSGIAAECRGDAEGTPRPAGGRAARGNNTALLSKTTSAGLKKDRHVGSLSASCQPEIK